MIGLETIRGALGRYAFTPVDEADLQEQVAAALSAGGVDVDREVIAARGTAPPRGVRVSWSLLRWVWPLTGWWSDYRWIARRS